MTRKETMLAKYGATYYSDIAKKVKNRKGFHTNGNARVAQAIGVKNREAKKAITGKDSTKS